MRAAAVANGCCFPAAAPCSLLLKIQHTQEDGISQEVQQELAAKGHKVRVCSSYGRSVFGKGQIIVRNRDSGVLCGGSDPRGDGCVMGW